MLGYSDTKTVVNSESSSCGRKKHLAKEPSSQVFIKKKEKGKKNLPYHLENQNLINVLISDE